MKRTPIKVLNTYGVYVYVVVVVDMVERLEEPLDLSECTTVDGQYEGDARRLDVLRNVFLTDVTSITVRTS